jgi:hypothetical protein
MAPATHNGQQSTSLEHIVPAFHLSNFCGDDGTLYVYERARPVRQSVPRRECAEHQFYEVNIAGERSENAYENWLASIEGDASRIVPLLRDRTPLGRSERVAWSRFVASLFVRTRKWRQQISMTMVSKMREQTVNEQYVRDLQYRLLQKGELHYAADLSEYVEQFQKRYENSPSLYHVTSIARHTDTIANVLLQKNWYTLSATPGKFFVTSDCPVLTVQHRADRWVEGAGFGKRDVIVFLPITATTAFAASSQFQIKDEAPPAYVDTINRVTIRFAHRNVYADRSSEEIRQLVDLEINQVIFGENAFLP